MMNDSVTVSTVFLCFFIIEDMTTLEKINEISEILQQFQSSLSDHMKEQKSRRKQLQNDINKLGIYE